MREFKSPSKLQKKIATPVVAPEEVGNPGEMEYKDSRASTAQFISLQSAASSKINQSHTAQLQTKVSNFTGNSKISQLQALSNSKSPATKTGIVQLEKNKTGLSDQLKSGMESISGMSLEDVKVHRNSDKPAQLHAHAYAQGTDIHLGPGQEKHLPHELGHVVQQKQGRVQPTVQMKGQVAINDSTYLEKEADVLGAKAKHLGTSSELNPDAGVAQRQGLEEEEPLQAKFDQSKVAQLAKEEKKGEEKSFFGKIKSWASSLFSKKIAPGDDLAEKANNAVGNTADIGNKVSSGVDSAKDYLPDMDVGANKLGGSVLGLINSVHKNIEKGRQLWEKQSLSAGADAFISAADLSNNVLNVLSTSDLIKEVPVLGGAVQSLNAGMHAFKTRKAIQLLEKQKGKGLSKEDEKTLDKLITTFKWDMASDGFDFLLGLANSVCSVVAPVIGGEIVSTVGLAKSAFVGAMSQWTQYRESKENQAKERFGSTDKTAAVELNEIVQTDKKRKLALGEQGASLNSIVNMKLDIDSLQEEIKGMGESENKTKKENELVNLTKTLNDSILTYNLSMAISGLNAPKINLSNVGQLAAIHASTMEKYINKVDSQKSSMELFKGFLNKKLGVAGPKKDAIKADFSKLTDKFDKSQTAKLSKSKYGGNLWSKTEEVLKEVASGSDTRSQATLRKQVEELLNTHRATLQLNADDIKQMTAVIK